MKSSERRREKTSKPAHSAYERDETAEGHEAAAEEERGLVTAEEALSDSEWEQAREDKAEKGTSAAEEETSGEDWCRPAQRGRCEEYCDETGAEAVGACVDAWEECEEE